MSANGSALGNQLQRHAAQGTEGFRESHAQAPGFSGMKRYEGCRSSASYLRGSVALGGVDASAYVRQGRVDTQGLLESLGGDKQRSQPLLETGPSIGTHPQITPRTDRPPTADPS